MNHIYDDAIQDESQDLLNYKRYLKPLKTVLEQYNYKGFFAIDGYWGIGKSSIKNMLRLELESKKNQLKYYTKRKKEIRKDIEKKGETPELLKNLQFVKDKHRDIKKSKNVNNNLIINVEASKYNTAKELYFSIVEKIIFKKSRFFQIIFTFILMLNYYIFLRVLDDVYESRLLFTIKSVFLIVALIPIFVTPLKLIILKLLHIFKNSPYGIFEGTLVVKGDKLKPKNKNLIIFIDDIDRITDHKYVMDIFKVAKERFNKCSVFYIYDSHKLMQLLSSKEGEKYSDNFFEKYVSYTLPIEMRKQDKLEYVKSINKYVKIQNYINNYYVDEFCNDIANLSLDNPRDIKNLMNNIVSNIELVNLERYFSVEINYSALILLEILRYYDPVLYRLIVFELYPVKAFNNNSKVSCNKDLEDLINKVLEVRNIKYNCKANGTLLFNILQKLYSDSYFQTVKNVKEADFNNDITIREFLVNDIETSYNADEFNLIKIFLESWYFMFCNKFGSYGFYSAKNNRLVDEINLIRLEANLSNNLNLLMNTDLENFDISLHDLYENKILKNEWANNSRTVISNGSNIINFKIMLGIHEKKIVNVKEELEVLNRLKKIIVEQSYNKLPDNSLIPIGLCKENVPFYLIFDLHGYYSFDLFEYSLGKIYDKYSYERACYLFFLLFISFSHRKYGGSNRVLNSIQLKGFLIEEINGKDRISTVNHLETLSTPSGNYNIGRVVRGGKTFYENLQSLLINDIDKSKANEFIAVINQLLSFSNEYDLYVTKEGYIFEGNKDYEVDENDIKLEDFIKMIRGVFVKAKGEYEDMTNANQRVYRKRIDEYIFSNLPIKY